MIFGSSARAAYPNTSSGVLKGRPAFAANSLHSRTSQLILLNISDRDCTMPSERDCTTSSECNCTMSSDRDCTMSTDRDCSMSSNRDCTMSAIAPKASLFQHQLMYPHCLITMPRITPNVKWAVSTHLCNRCIFV